MRREAQKAQSSKLKAQEKLQAQRQPRLREAMRFELEAWGFS
jgi:hypothetical protein